MNSRERTFAHAKVAPNSCEGVFGHGAAYRSPVTAIIWIILLVVPGVGSAQTSTEPISTPSLKTVVIEAFSKTHDGWSADEVILQTALNDAFIHECQNMQADAKPTDLNWTLLNIRKSGKLKIKSHRRSAASTSEVDHVGEMAARKLMDQHKVSIDRVMCDPELRSQFAAAATALAPEVDLYLVRKAAFRLRKTRKLKPELITRIADWGRQVTEYQADSLVTAPDKIPAEPGIYIFRDASGYLYIGEAKDLRARLSQHLDDSDRKSLGNYLKDEGFDQVLIELHTFEAGSRINDLPVRRAYESELIRSRKPRFNVRP